jgi:hypothetical protein
MTARMDDDVLELLLDQRFETDHGTVSTRDATTDDIQPVLHRIRASLARLIDTMATTTDQDRLDHLTARIAALIEQSEELRVALAWATAKKAHAESCP